MTYFTGWTVRNKSIFVFDLKGKGHYFCPEIQVTKRLRDICSGKYFLEIKFYVGSRVESVVLERKLLGEKFFPYLLDKGFSLSATENNSITLCDILMEQENALDIDPCHTKLGYQTIKGKNYYFGKEEISGKLTSTYVGDQDLSCLGAFCEWQDFIRQELAENPLLALPLAMGASAPVATRLKLAGVTDETLLWALIGASSTGKTTCMKLSASAWNRPSGDGIIDNLTGTEKYFFASLASREGYPNYFDEARSGRTDRREGFQEMIADAKNNPPWSKILVYDMSRFARNSTDASNYTSDLEDLGIELISVTQEFDDSNEGFLMKGIVNLLNEYYSRNLAKHTHAGLKQKAKDGKHCGGTPPLGYDVVNGRLVINEYEAEIVRLIYDMYENLFSYSQMAKELNSKGYTNKQKKPFTTNSFFSILHQEKYIGTYTWNKAVKKNNKGKRNNHKQKPESDQIILKDAVPAIIDKEQFERVQQLFISRRNGTAPTKSRHFYLLSGGDFLKCAYCGSNLIGSISSSHGKKYKYYYCPNHRDKKGEDKCPCVGISADLIEPFVIRAVVSDIYNRDDLISIYNHTDEQDKIKTLTAQLRGLEKTTRSLLNTTTVTYNTPAYKDACARLKEVAQQKKNIKAEVEKLVAAQKAITEDDRRKVCKEIIKMLETTNVLETKKYLKSVISSILVSNEDINVTLNIA